MNTAPLLVWLLALLVPLAAAEPESDAGPQPEVLRLERVDGSSAHRLTRALDRAREGSGVLLTRFGDVAGDPRHAGRLIDAALGADDVRLVAIVEGTVSGAASALVLAHHERYLGPDALLGAIGRGEDAGTASVLTAKLRRLAERRELPTAAVLALAATEDPTSHTADEALATGLATAIVSDDDDLAAAAGLDLSPDAAGTTDGDAAPAAGTGVDGAPERPAERPVGTVAYLKVEGVIDDIQLGYFRRSLEQAAAAGADLVVTHIESPGGYLHSAVDMVEEALRRAGDDDPRLIAFVDTEAISAAAALAYSHAEIYMAPQAKIGDIGVIFQTSEGIEYAPEKIETFMRAQLRSIADVRGWDRALLSKMTARNQVLYEVHRADGSTDYVIGDDLESYLRQNPEIDRESQVVQLLGEDRLLTLTATEAADMGMATALVDDLDALYARLGIDATAVLDLTPTTNERIAWSLAGWAPLLAALAVMFIIFEFKTPGVGLWATLAAIAGTAFFFCQYYLDLANHLEVVLVVLGIALVLVDIFTAVASGALALSGAALMLVGLVLAFMPDGFQFDVTDDRWAEALGSAALNSLLATTVAVIGALIFIAALPHSPLLRRIAVTREIEGDSRGDWERGEGSTLVGQRGVVTAGLHPGGWVRIGDDERSARSVDGMHIDKGTEVEVVRLQFGELVVRPARAADAEAAS